MPRSFAIVIRVIPEAILAVTFVLPTRVADDRIQSDAVQLTTVAERELAFARHIFEPIRPRVALAPGLGDQYWSVIALPDVEQHARKRFVACITTLDGRAIEHELIVRVEVDADDIQVAGVPAELLPNFPAQHVPGLVLQEFVRLDSPPRLRMLGRRHDVNQWVRLDEARAWEHGA